MILSRNFVLSIIHVPFRPFVSSSIFTLQLFPFIQCLHYLSVYETLKTSFLLRVFIYFGQTSLREVNLHPFYQKRKNPYIFHYYTESHLSKNQRLVKDTYSTIFYITFGTEIREPKKKRVNSKDHFFIKFKLNLKNLIILSSYQHNFLSMEH